MEQPTAGEQAVSAAVINYNGARFLKSCLQSVLAQTSSPSELLVIDNRSTDESIGIVRDRFPQVRLVELPRNLGYAGAANVAVHETCSPLLLLLNPDVTLMPTFVETLTAFACAHPEAGSFTGKLLRPPRPDRPPVIDSTGHVLFRNRWAVNRGEGVEDHGQYEASEEVFGVSGAAPLYRRAMLEDVQVNGETFAESFFVYLEDVDLDWRARLLGWKAYCVPEAVAYHERGYKGGDRRRNVWILRHSVKNRYLMMVRNDALGDVLLDAWAIVPMEILRFLDFLLTVPGSLRGYLDAMWLLPEAIGQRRVIRGRTRASRHEIRRWLRRYPYRREVMERAKLLLGRFDS